MRRTNLWISQFVAMAALLFLPAFGLTQTVNIDNGVVGVGHLDVNVDAYGAFGNFNAAYVDNFEPTTGGSSQPTFTAGFRLFSGFDRVALTEMADWTAILTNPTWAVSTTTALANVGASTATSSFDVLDAAGAQVLSFDLTQTVSAESPGVALLDQSYVITNNSGSALDFNMNRVLDGDLVWGTPFDDDHVSASSPLGFVAQHEPGNLSQAIALTSGPGGIMHDFYWGGKNTHVPTGGNPPLGFGTDTVVWVNMGLPVTWQNYIAYSGYDLPGGDSGTVLGQDAHIGLDWSINLANGASTTLNVRTVYGATSLADCLVGDVNMDGVTDLLDVAPFVDAITTGTFSCEADADGNGVVDLLDVAPFVDILTGP